MGEKYEPRLGADKNKDLDFALGRAGAALAELVRRQSDEPDKPFWVGLDENMRDELLLLTGTRLNPEKYHENRDVDEDVVLDVAKKMGFVKMDVYRARNAMERRLNIYSEPAIYEGAVNEILVFAAAGLSNLVRLYHAVNAIKTGAVKTNRIIIAAGQRETSEAERAKLESAGFASGKSEFELGMNAVKDLLGIEMEQVNGVPMKYADREYMTKLAQAQVEIDGCEVKMEVLEAPYDPARKLENGKLATRANTEETLVSLRELISGDGGVTYVVSHDMWQPVQEMITRRMLPGRTIVGSGPQNLDRIYRDSESGTLKLKGAGGMQDELKKYFQELLKVHPVTKE